MPVNITETSANFLHFSRQIFQPTNLYIQVAYSSVNLSVKKQACAIVIFWWLFTSFNLKNERTAVAEDADRVRHNFKSAVTITEHSYYHAIILNNRQFTKFFYTMK